MPDGSIMQWTEPQQGAVAGIAERAVRHASLVLADIVEGEIGLGLSYVDVTSRAVATARLADGAQRRPAVAVRQSFTGAFSGEVMLVFCEQQSLQLVRALLADTVPLEMMTDLEQDALTEVGNVVLNACLGSLAQQLGSRLTSVLPRYARSFAACLLDDAAIPDREAALFLHLAIALEPHEIDGYLIFLMDHASLDRFRERIDNYLQKA